MRHVCLTSLALSVAFGCDHRENVQCESSSNCDLIPGGVCITATDGNHWCASPDPACPSDYRYFGVDVGGDLAGVCVVQTDAGSGSDVVCKQSVVFADTVYMIQGETSEIWVSNLDGTQVRNVSNSPAQDIQPDWSPSGTRIAFASSRNTLSNQADRYDIYIVDADGKNLINLTSGSRGNNTNPRWSPDGTRIAFLRNSVVWVMNADGSAAFSVTSQLKSRYFAWSPLGNQMVLDDLDLNSSTSRGLYLLTLGDSSLPRKITSLTGTEGSPKWYPGSRILFTFQSDLYSVNSDGSLLQNVTKDGMLNDDAQPVADLKTIAFDSDHGNGGPEIWIVSLGQNKQLTHNTKGSGEIFYATDISRDGRYVAFEHRKFVETNPDGNIWEVGVVSADGNNMHTFNAPGSSIADRPKLAPCSSDEGLAGR